MRRTVSTVPLLVACLTGCGPAAGEPTPLPSPPPLASAREDLVIHAAAARDLVAVSVYSLVRPGAPERTLRVVRAGDGTWRVDVPGGGLGGTVDLAMVGTADGQFQCVLTGVPRCVRAEPLPAAADPRVHHVFTDWLAVLNDRSAALSVSTAPVPAGVAGTCFSVQSGAASLEAPVEPGVYCFEPDGTLTAAELGLGTLTLVGTDSGAPDSVDLPAPVTGDEPVPTDPPPTATAGTAPSRTPGAGPSPAPAGW